MGKTESLWLALCAVLAVGEWAGFLSREWCSMWPLAFILSVFLVMAAYSISSRRWHWLAVFAIGFVLALHVADCRRRVLDDALEVNAGRPFSVCARVERDATVAVDEKGRRWASFRVDSSPIAFSVVAQIGKRREAPKADETWRCTGWLDSDRDDDVGRRRRLWVKGRGASIECVAPAQGGIRKLLRCARADVARRLGIGLEGDPEAHAFARALLLGDKDGLSPRWRQVFADSGAAHVFAISGLHVMVIARLLSVLALFVFAGPRVAPLFVVPLLWFYVGMTGSSPSALRAALMATFHCIAPVFWRRPNGLVSWSLAFLLLHLISPESIMDVGSRLSFAVMLALVLWSRWSARFGRGRWEGVFVSIVAWVAGVPIVAASFGRFTPSAVFSGAFMVGSAAIAVVTGVAGVACSLFSDMVAAYLNRMSALVLRVMSGACETLAEIPAGSFDVRPWTTFDCLAWYAVFVLSLYLVTLHRKESGKHL